MGQLYGESDNLCNLDLNWDREYNSYGKNMKNIYNLSKK